jgi:hypothetical protein
LSLERSCASRMVVVLAREVMTAARRSSDRVAPNREGVNFVTRVRFPVPPRTRRFDGSGAAFDRARVVMEATVFHHRLMTHHMPEGVCWTYGITYAEATRMEDSPVPRRCAAAC